MRHDIGGLLGRAGRRERRREGASKRSGGSAANVEALEPRQLLTTFSVTTLADSGSGSLRQAVLDANGLAGADVIEFDTGLIGPIALGGEPTP